MENIKIFSGKDYLALLSLAAFSLLVYSYLPDCYYIPFILKSADPSLFANDLFVNSQSTYNSYYFTLVGWLSRHLDLGVLFAVLHGLIVYAAALSFFALSMTLFKERKAAYLSVFLLLIPKSAVSLALAGINIGFPEPSAFVAPFLLLAILLFFKGAYRTASMLCGAIFYFHGMEALLVSVMFCFYFAARIKKLPPGIVAASVLLLALPVLPLAWKMLSAGFFEFSAPGDVARWLEILRLRSWFHLFPLSWGISDWFNYSGWFLWAFIVYRYAKPSPKQEMAVDFIKAIFLLCAFSTVFTEFFPVPAVIKLVFWRSTRFFLFLLVIYIGHYLAEFQARSAAAALLAACSIAAIFLGLYKLIVCLALLHLAFETRSGKPASRFFAGAGLAGLSMFLLGTLLQPENGLPLPQKLVLFTDIGLKNLVIFSLLAFSAFSCFRSLKAGRSRAAIAALAIMAFSVVAIGRLWVEKAAAAEKAINGDWRAAQLWARENTALDSVFITPAYLEGFRIHSRRSVVMELKDGAPALYSVPFAFKWWQRVEDFGYKGGGEGGALGAEMKRLYGNYSENDIKKLSDKYKASYFVAESGSRYKFRELYRNGHFSVYSTEGAP